MKKLRERKIELKREREGERGRERDRENLGTILICGESMDVSIS